MSHTSALEPSLPLSRGGEGLIIEKKQVNFKVHFGLFKAFLDHVFFFPLRGVGGWGGGAGGVIMVRKKSLL